MAQTQTLTGQHATFSLGEANVGALASVSFDRGRTGTEQLIASLGDAGFSAAELVAETSDTNEKRNRDFLARLGVAGFAAANVMLLSVSVWSADASSMDPATRGLLHWISALIALPAVIYSGQPFFRSAWQGLRVLRLNMDVPISLAIILSTGMSLVQTMLYREHIYFDACIALLLFLLIGRYLDQRMRVRVGCAALEPGSEIFAGTVNLGAPVEAEITNTETKTLLAELTRLMEMAEHAGGCYVRLADHAARLYSPAMHMLAAATFFGWIAGGAGWEFSLLTAIAVLIVTSSSALVLAVPAVQIAAADRLFARGVLLKAADGLEKLSEVDTVIFDKTGTLTEGQPALSGADEIGDDVLRGAAALAVASHHPYALAVVAAAKKRFGSITPAPDIVEEPGHGLKAATADGEARLGSAEWCGVSSTSDEVSLYYAAPGQEAVSFRFADPLRPDAAEIVRELMAAGFAIEIMSGDRAEAVEPVARRSRDHGLAGGLRSTGKNRPARRSGRNRPQGADGRRWPARCPGAGCGPCLAVAVFRRRYQPDDLGRRVPGRQSAPGDRIAGDRAARSAYGISKPRHSWGFTI